jgi:ATP-binding cassette, subfamily F, member 3
VVVCSSAQGTLFRFRFPPGPRLQGEIINVEHVSHGYEGSLLFEDTSLTIEKGDRVAVIGPNGVGKSTLLRLVMGLEKPQQGKAEFVSSSAVGGRWP